MLMLGDHRCNFPNVFLIFINLFQLLQFGENGADLADILAGDFDTRTTFEEQNNH